MSAAEEPVGQAGVAGGGLRRVALSGVLASIEDAFGAGVLRDAQRGGPVAALSTGSLALDLATGCGGLPRGRITELFGAEATGKTTLALHAVARLQAAGGTAAFVDAEHALDPRYAAALGVRLSALVLAEPGDGEQAFEIVEALVRSGSVDLVVVDSVAALVPRAEIEGGMTAAEPALHARLMSRGVRKLNNALARSPATLLFLNQLRHRPGAVPTEVATGGNALKYFASLRVELSRVGELERGPPGVRARARTVKNRLSTPFQQAELAIVYGRGVDRPGELGRLARAHGLLPAGLAGFTSDDDLADALRAWPPDAIETLEARLRARVGGSDL